MEKGLKKMRNQLDSVKKKRLRKMNIKLDYINRNHITKRNAIKPRRK